MTFTLTALPRVPRLLLAFVVFEAAWFACILGAAHGQVLAGVAAVAMSIGLQLALSNDRPADLRIIGAALLTGCVWDTLLAQAHVVSYWSSVPWADFAPVWIIALWMQLGSVLREPLAWLHGRPLLAALIGGVGGAASYAGAARLGACSFAEPDVALSVIAIGWAVMTPVLLALAKREAT